MISIEADGILLAIEGLGGDAQVIALAPYGDAICWIFNNATRGVFGDFETRLVQGEDIFGAGNHLFCTRPSRPEDIEELAQEWQRFSGASTSEDLLLIGVAGLGNAVPVPRSTLLRLWKQFQEVRRTCHPPVAQEPQAPVVSRRVFDTSESE